MRRVQAIVHALRVPGFARLATTYTLNELADWLAAIALSILVFDATGDPMATTALFLAVKFAPGLLVPALAARLERYPVARVLRAVYLLEACVLVVLALLVGSFWLPLVLALGLVDGTLAAVARATTRAATPALLEPHGLLREGNATLNVGFAAMNVVGPAAGGVLVALTGAAPVLTIAAVLFLAKAGIIAGARGLQSAPADPAPWRMRLREAASYVRSRPVLRTLLIGQFIVVVLAMMVAPIEVVLAKETLDAGDMGFGALAGSWGAGMLLGSWLFARERERSMMSLIGVATAAVGVGYIGMAFAPDIVSACAASALGGIGNGIQWVAVVTALQEATEERFQGRVAGLVECVLTLGPGIGFPLGGAIAALASPRIAFAVSGAGVLAVLLLGGAALGVRRSVRARQPEPAPEPAG
jgi:Transmembrane secretion effector